MGEKSSGRVVGQRAPPALTWHVCQMCRASPTNPFSSADARISKADLETLAVPVLAALNKKSRVKQKLSKFLQSDEASLFLVPPEQLCQQEGQELYFVNVVPVMLGACGLDLSVEAWEDILSSLQQRLAEKITQTMQTMPASGNHCPLFDLASSMSADDSTDFTDTWPGAVDFVDDDMTMSGSIIGARDDGDHGGHELDSASSASASRPLTVSDDSQVSLAVPWFDRLSREELLIKLHERDDRIAALGRELDQALVTKQKPTDALKERLKAKQNECRRLVRKNASQAAEKASLQKKLDLLKAMIIERGNSRSKRNGDSEAICDRGWLTPSGTIQLAIKRNLAHCASEQLQLLIQQDVSRWTVSSFLAACDVLRFAVRGLGFRGLGPCLGFGFIRLWFRDLGFR